MVSDISGRFSPLGRRMLLSLHYDASSSEYKVDVRATTTTMEVMTRRLTGQAPSDGFTTPQKPNRSSSSAMAYPFPYYTVTIGHRGVGELEPTQVQGDDGEALVSHGDALSLADLAIGCTCDDPREGLCKHAALAARLLLVRGQSIGGGREEAFTNEEASSLCTSTVKSPQESDGEESRPLRAASSLLSGYHLYQVVVHPAITCSVVMKDPIKVGASSSVAMAICSACPEGQHQERCEHIALAVDTVARHSFKRSPVDKLAPAKTENIARRLVFTEPITELKGQLQPGEDMQRSLVVIEDGDTRDHQGARDDCPSSSLKRRRAIPHSSADLSSVALTAAVKQRRSQCENVIEGVDDERRASGGGGQAMPGSYRALLQQYL